MSKPKYQSLSGMHDILPEDFLYFDKLVKVVKGVANYYNFDRIETPIAEATELFLKGLGSDTDIIGKEMYTFTTKGGDSISLRPEGTTPVMRAYFEHGMHTWPQPVKLWYLGPFFRYERPQAGRTRQFWQYGFEAIGDKSPSIDSQMIQMGYDILKEMGFKNLSIQINSIGDDECRPYFKKILTNYFKTRRASLSPDCQRKMKDNPFRILDCKEEKCQQVKSQAPQIMDHLCESCHSHFKQVLEFLDELELPYMLNPYLVRGLDYYTKTVFEIIENTEGGPAQDALIGGGRYDNLAKLLGMKPEPACGFGGSYERIVSFMKGADKKVERKEVPQIFLAQIGQMAKQKSMKLFEEFRKAKIPVAESFSKDSLRAQLRMADKMGVKWILIYGQKEALENFITLRDMETGVQKEIDFDKIIEEMKKRIKEKN